MGERWEEYAPGIWVSDLGRVKGPHGIKEPRVTNKGCLCVNYYDEGPMHRALPLMVAECFVKMPCAGCNKVIHKDGDKFNNRADNLEWYVSAANRKKVL